MLHLRKLSGQVFFFWGERQNIVAKTKAISVKANFRERRQRKSLSDSTANWSKCCTVKTFRQSDSKCVCL